jgi:hypothetical protein
MEAAAAARGGTSDVLGIGFGTLGAGSTRRPALAHAGGASVAALGAAGVRGPTGGADTRVRCVADAWGPAGGGRTRAAC